ncbi:MULTISPECIES: Flp pilus assembly protein CpaB [Comamonas]|uniref:Flp pilus assembly protein CpaB n=1 Tax=Comamonas TaxID=283 RepID=UPI001C45BF4C|nr:MULTISPECIES: Flp pilus assembly protein CpaB [Comamonas]MBV7418834.1 Flp pilus assembly protein CpaB [Comamonas sp. CMM03]MDH0048065.1 Flp pilus assembly protein CpaB [Comamonas terrigena]MDH0510335.1 Flp pilus assembly protein CpaB [Comamonas terrigena]MDH1089937.1 Flp pilus assembly protein CpaB [Comamonas terrigena]MDH1291839.1 Flp pilus assembly protein CpaB [Comamonas terrigena]
MKNLKALGLFVLAALASLAAAVYAANWVAQRGSIDADKVVVAVSDIPLGSKILPTMLSTVDWPRGSIPNGAFHDIQQLQDRVVKVGVLRGEAVLEGKLAPVGTRGGLAAVIAPGKRAMTVRVNDVVGVAGFALPGNHVDVVVNAQTEQGGKSDDARQISKTVLENVLVLAVAQEADRDETKPKVVSAVTLELSPEEAEKLDLARSVGNLSLVLRNQIDKDPVSTAGITKHQLFGTAEPTPPSAPVKVAVAKPAAPRARPAPLPSAATCVEVIQGGTSTLNCF